MRFFPSIILTLALLTRSLLTAQEIRFHPGDWTSALELAARENKLVFMDAYTTWCGPCRMMDRQTFKDPRVAEFFNASFINVKMDMEKGEGPELARQYQVQAYPTLLFVDPAGQIVHRVAGFHNPEQFLELGQTALDPEKTLRSWELRYERGERDPQFLHDYTWRRYQSMDGSHHPIAKAYLATQQDWQTPQNLEFVFHFAEYLDDSMFHYLVLHRELFERHFGETAMNNKIEDLFGDAAFYTTPDWKATQALLEIIFPRDADRQLLFLQMNHFQQREDMANYVATTMDYFRKYPTRDADILNDAAWTFYERVEDPEALKQALKWAQQAVKLEDNYHNNDTLAALYAKLGMKKKARKSALHAIELAKANGLDHSITDELLQSL